MNIFTSSLWVHKFFDTDLNWRVFNGDWVTESLFSFSGLFLVFEMILIMLWSVYLGSSFDFWCRQPLSQALFYGIFSCLASSTYFFFIFILWSVGSSFFLLIKTRLGFLVGIASSVCISKSKRIIMSLISVDGFLLVYIPYGNMVKFHSLAQFQVYHLSHPIVPSLAFYYYVLSLPPHNQHLLSCELSIF